jgi:hypothetical protein
MTATGTRGDRGVDRDKAKVETTAEPLAPTLAGPAPLGPDLPTATRQPGMTSAAPEMGPRAGADRTSGRFRAAAGLTAPAS